MVMAKANCAACGHSPTQHTGDEGCWGGTFADCGCRALTKTRPPVDEIDRYGVLDKDEDPKAEGQARAVEAAPEPWKVQFARVAGRLADSGRPFTSEDVIAIVGLPSGGVETNQNNAVGAMMSGLARQGLIRKTGQRVLSLRETSHGAELTEWIGVKE